MKSFGTLEDYIKAAVANARYEKIEGGKKLYAEIPGFRGVWAEGRTREEVKSELRSVLKGWIELQLERGQPIPSIGGVRLAKLEVA